MSLPSYKRDPVGDVETWRNNAAIQPSPFRQNQMMGGDRRSRGPLQYYPVRRKTIFDKYPRASTAGVVIVFLTIYTSFKYDALQSFLNRSEK